MPQPVLALAVAVKRRGVVVADAPLPGPLQRGLRVPFGDLVEQFAQRRPAEADLADLLRKAVRKRR